MATAGALLGLVVPGVAVDDIECTSKTIPDFAARWVMLVTNTARLGSRSPVDNDGG
jgi:3-phosphoshikimate 1-carboxyvinyltransferase